MSAQLAACDCAHDPTTLHEVVSPSTQDGLRVPALRFGDPGDRAPVLPLLLPPPVRRADQQSLRELLVAGLIPGYSARQMTYDLRRLRRKGLIRRAPGSQHYELTNHGRRIAVFFTRTHTRILNLAPAVKKASVSCSGQGGARARVAAFGVW